MSDIKSIEMNQQDEKNKKQDYLSIVCNQDAQGFFSNLPTEFSHLSTIAIPQSILDILSDSDKSLRVWITILSICILRKHFKDSQDEWTMISKKAESYLKSMNITNYKQEIKEAMSYV